MNAANILSRATISSTQMLQSPQRAVLQQQRKFRRLVTRIQNAIAVDARIHESERVACFSVKYQSVKMILCGNWMMRCCRAYKASGLHLAIAASSGGSSGVGGETASACTSASFRAHDVPDHCSLFARNAHDTLARIEAGKAMHAS